jgi:hypothetical protein
VVSLGFSISGGHGFYYDLVVSMGNGGERRSVKGRKRSVTYRYVMKSPGTDLLNVDGGGILFELIEGHETLTY